MTTPAPPRYGEPEPTMGVSPQDGVVARDHGRGRGRRPTRSIG